MKDFLQGFKNQWNNYDAGNFFAMMCQGTLAAIIALASFFCIFYPFYWILK